MKAKKTIKEYTLDKKAKKLQAELFEAAKKEEQEVLSEIQAILDKKGYAISARMILEPDKAPTVAPFIFKVKK